MSYDEARRREQWNLNDESIREFIDRYKAKNPPQRRTIFMFPGGMGSKLNRTTSPYDDREPGQEFQFQTVWLTVETITEHLARHFRMKKMPDGSFREADDHIIVAAGSVDFGCDVPYAGFSAWCKQQDIDWYILGWDWRRRLEDSRDFFLDDFFPKFEQRVADETDVPQPLGRISLVGHSAGGMLANLILRSGHDLVGRLDRVVTVATPFYGYGGQLHRWTEGEPYLNGPFNQHKDEIKQIVASLPGCYELHYVDEATFAANLNDLMRDEFFITQYPSRDEGAAALNADPYNPGNRRNPAGTRYPGNTGFDEIELDHARDVVALLASPMAADLADKFFNIRGSRGVKDTVGCVRWDWIPDEPEPVRDEFLDEGDDTQPAWTARLASLRRDHVITVRKHDITHMFMMDHDDVLAELGVIVG